LSLEKDEGGHNIDIFILREYLSIIIIFLFKEEDDDECFINFLVSLYLIKIFNKHKIILCGLSTQYFFNKK